MLPQVNGLLDEDRFLEAAELLRSHVLNEMQVDGVLKVTITTIYSLLEGDSPNIASLREILADEHKALRRRYRAALYRKENPRQDKAKLIDDLMHQLNQVILDEREVDEEAFAFVD